MNTGEDLQPRREAAIKSSTAAALARPHRRSRLRWLAFFLAVHLLSTSATWKPVRGRLVAGATPSREGPAGCAWTEPPSESLLTRHPPAGTIKGSLTTAVVPLLRRSGVPLCLVATAGDAQVRLVTAPATLAGVFQELVRQAPRYQFRGIDGKLVLYPRESVWDLPIDLGPRQSLTRAAGYFFVLRGLRAKVKELSKVSTGLHDGGAGWGKRSLSDMIEVGGSRTVVEHLVSLAANRPGTVFDLSAQESRLYFQLIDLPLIQSIEIHLPPKVNVGQAFQIEVSGKLADGTAISLTGPECWVAYASSDPAVLEIDDSGRGVAHQKGHFTVYANYQGVPDARAEINVE